MEAGVMEHWLYYCLACSGIALAIMAEEEKKNCIMENIYQTHKAFPSQ